MSNSEVELINEQLQANTTGDSTQDQVNDPSNDMFQKALRLTETKQYEEALDVWQIFLVQYATATAYPQAQYHSAYCFFRLQKNHEAIDTLRSILGNTQLLATQNIGFISEARILLIKVLIKESRLDEALALTFDALPNTKAEKYSGLKRSKYQEPSLVHKIQFMILRGQIYGALLKTPEAEKALSQAQEWLQTNTIDESIKLELQAHWAWKHIENIFILCKKKNPFPPKLSESEFLDYSEKYYQCINSTRLIFCHVYVSKNSELYKNALKTFQSLATYPMILENPLPTPARSIKKPGDKSYYEVEMRTLIENTVNEKLKLYKNIDACGAYNLF